MSAEQQAVLGIPITLAAAFVGGIVAWVVATINNRHALKRVRLELQHDATERDHERAMALRRDVYLPAMEAILEVQRLATQALKLSSEPAHQSGNLQSAMAPFSKLQLVASIETIGAVNKYLNAMLPTIAEVGIRRITLGAELKAAENESLPPEQRLQKLRAYVAGLAELAEVTATRTLASTPLLADVVICARRDIGMPIDAAAYRALELASQEELQKVLRNLTQFVRGLVK